jgi:hypothetical protein
MFRQSYVCIVLNEEFSGMSLWPCVPAWRSGILIDAFVVFLSLQSSDKWRIYYSLIAQLLHATKSELLTAMNELLWWYQAAVYLNNRIKIPSFTTTFSLLHYFVSAYFGHNRMQVNMVTVYLIVRTTDTKLRIVLKCGSHGQTPIIFIFLPL